MCHDLDMIKKNMTLMIFKKLSVKPRVLLRSLNELASTILNKPVQCTSNGYPYKCFHALKAVEGLHPPPFGWSWEVFPTFWKQVYSTSPTRPAALEPKITFSPMKFIIWPSLCHSYSCRVDEHEPLHYSACLKIVEKSGLRAAWLVEESTN